MKKIFTFILALVAGAGTIFAEGGTCGADGDNLTWDLTDGVLTISGTGAMADYEWGGPWYANRESITSLIIGDGVTSIGDCAFGDCSVLATIELPNSLESIGVYAFAKCSGLTSVTIPNSVTSIEDYAFYYCTALASVTLGEGVEYIWSCAFSGCKGMTSITCKAVNPPTCFYLAFEEVDKFIPVYVPAASVEDYKNAEGWGDFKYIFAIGTEVKFNKLTFNLNLNYAINDDCVVYADDEYVSDGESLKVVAGEPVHLRFEPQQFWAIEKLLLNGVDVTDKVVENKVNVTVTEDATLETQWYQPTTPYDFAEKVASGQTLYFMITDKANRKVEIVNQSGGRGYAGRQQHAYIEKNGEGVWDASVDLQPKGDLIIPTTIEHGGQTYIVTAIDTMAFCNCSELTSVSIPEGIMAIGCAAFMNCRGIYGKVVVPVSCSVVGEWAFRDCNLSEIDLGGATSLEEYVLLGNRYMKQVVTGPAVKLFNTNCLRSMWYLESVVIGENVEFVNSGSFGGDTNLKTVKILAKTPPAVKWTPEGYEESYWYDYDPSPSGIDATLIVPSSPDHSILDAYKNAECWKLFGTIVEQGPETALEMSNDQMTKYENVKIIRDGQLYILRDGKLYTTTGREVR